MPKKNKIIIGLHQAWHFARWAGKKAKEVESVGKMGIDMMVVAFQMGGKGIGQRHLGGFRD